MAKKHIIVGKHLEGVIVLHNEEGFGDEMPYLPFTSLSCLSHSVVLLAYLYYVLTNFTFHSIQPDQPSISPSANCASIIILEQEILET
jgi:hypothetical protein